jgi:competence protein ComEA
MNPTPPDGERTRSQSVLFLRRIDQPAVAVVLCACLLLTGLFVFRLWRTKQGVIDIDHRPTRSAQLYVDLNAAPWPEFANLPGIGEFLGRMIVSYRQQHGEFRAIEEVKMVPGIGESRYRQIKPYLVIADPVRH